MKMMTNIVASLTLGLAMIASPATAQDTQASANHSPEQMKKCTAMKDGKKVEGMMMKSKDGKAMCHAMSEMKMDHAKMMDMDHGAMDHSKMDGMKQEKKADTKPEAN